MLYNIHTPDCSIVTYEWVKLNFVLDLVDYFPFGRKFGHIHNRRCQEGIKPIKMFFLICLAHNITIVDE